VKTAISVPDDTFARASRRAKELGISRSEFFARAARQYLEQLDTQSTTRQIDAAVAQLTDAEAAGMDESVEASAADAVAVGRGVLAAVDDEW
jgi:metal-responsive CopG/Arc/MetJ family transcriptional regulator